MPRSLVLLLALAIFLFASCGGDGGDDRSQIEDVTEQFFEGLLEGDCDQIGDALAIEEQIPEGQCRDFISSLESRFADAVSSSFGGGLDEFELGLEDVRSVDVEGGDEATAAVVVHLKFGSDGDLSDVFEIEGADGEISGEVNIPSGFSYVKQEGDWKVAQAFESPGGEEEGS